MSTNADDKWAKSPDYPTKKGNCDVCGHRDTIKLAFDQHRYICTNAHACLLRWKAKRAETLSTQGD